MIYLDLCQGPISMIGTLVQTVRPSALDDKKTEQLPLSTCNKKSEEAGTSSSHRDKRRGQLAEPMK
jgi:hypothetical protein